MFAARELLIRPCEMCGERFESWGGYGAKYCPSCRPEANKRRCADWYQRNRTKHIENTTRRKREVGTRPAVCYKKNRNDWIVSAPGYGSVHLPGGACSLEVSPVWTVEHRHIVPLHGLITALTGAHNPNIPRFVLIPANTTLGWGLYLAEDELSRSFARKVHSGRLSTSQVRLTAGPLMRIKAPAAPERRRHRVRVDALTPVQIRSHDGTTNSYPAPTAGNMTSTLTAWLPRRVGLDVDPEGIRAKIELVERETFQVRVPLRKVLRNSGWVGHCVLDVNAPALWLLRVAERIGLGGRTSFGFGRIRVTEIEC